MTVKEALVTELQKAGYDTVTACELAHTYIQELKAKPPGTHSIQVGSTVVCVKVGESCI